jgi:hypothetical protein
MYYFRAAVEGGGLISHGADVPDLVRLAAKYVARILKVQNSASSSGAADENSRSLST